MALHGIAAVNKKNFIGKNGEIMWKSKADFKHFKDSTSGGILIMGGTTFEKDLKGRLLPNRATFVVSHRAEILGQKTYRLWDAVEEAYRLKEEMSKNSGIIHFGFPKETKIWVVGGETIYRQLMPIIKEFHLSVINDEQEGDRKLLIDDWGFKGELKKYYFEVDQ